MIGQLPRSPCSPLSMDPHLRRQQGGMGGFAMRQNGGSGDGCGGVCVCVGVILQQKA